ncbi:MAG: hypothetical protein U9Q98_12935 [Bacteroidota bacterium]|nr:hypothetical protein [Bacteroidota bacterium]
MEDIVYVGTQKNLNDDFLRLKEILNFPEYVQLPYDNVNTHKNPEYLDKHLDTAARKNLEKWYETDYHFLKLLKENNLIQSY